MKQRYFIELAYDGTSYHGWQVQDNANTVQETLNNSLATILREPIETIGCGRTDSGVHARQFFAHFDSMSTVNNPASIERQHLAADVQGPSKSDHAPSTVDNGQSLVNQGSLAIDDGPPSIDYPPSAIDHGRLTNDGVRTINLVKTVNSLNAILPEDIAVKRIVPVIADAHARFDATLRSYEYHVHFHKDPFKNAYSWRLRDIPDLALMNQAARMMLDYTDFSCFSKSNTQVKTFNCKISRAEWVYKDHCLVFHISADRFLRNMVRAIVGTLMTVGRKEIEPEGIRAIIESKNRGNAGTSVPACGLYLTEVKYPYL